ncbi:MAG: hypothetical protein ACR2N2_12705 [Acidimicrobiia bacterium]
MSEDLESADQPVEAQESDSPDDPGWPWSFLLLVFAGALYLIFRLVDFVIDVVR